MARKAIGRSESRKEAGRIAREEVKSGRYLQKQEESQQRRIRQPLGVSAEVKAQQEFEARPSQIASTFEARQNMNEQRMKQSVPEKLPEKVASSFKPISTLDKLGIASPRQKPFQEQKKPDSRLLRTNPDVKAVAVPRARTPIGAALQQVKHGMQSAVNFQQRPSTEVPSTGNKVVDALLRGTGETLSGLPAGDVGGLGTISRGVSYGLSKAGQKILPNVLKPSPLTSRVAGLATEGAIENVAVGMGAGQTSGEDIATNLKYGAGFGAAAPLAGAGIKSGAKAVGKYVRKIAEETTSKNLAFQKAVSEVGEQAAKADIGKRNLADIDEQLNSLSNSTSPNKNEQFKALFNERNDVIDYIKKHDPEFEAPKARVRTAGNQAQQQPIEQTPQPVRPPTTASQGTQKGTPGIRSNPITQRESGAFSDELTSRINPEQRYDIAHNIDTLSRVDDMMKDVPNAENAFFNKTLLHSGRNADHTMLGYRLMQEFDAKGDYDRAIRVSQQLAEDLTKSGQQVQAASVINRLSPQGQLRLLTNKAALNKMEVTPKDWEAFGKAAEKVKDAGGADIRETALSKVIDKLDAGQEPTAEDIALIKNIVERTKKYLPEEKPRAKRQKIGAEKPQEATKEKQSSPIMDKLQAAEDAAWARIKANRNIGFVPSGRSNDVIDYAIIATNRIAKGLVNQSNHVGELVRMFGEEVRPIATKIFNAAKDRIASDPQLRNLRNKVTTAEDVVQQFERRMQPNATDLKKIKQLAADLSKLDNMSKTNADIEMQKIMNKYEKASIGDKIQALRYLMMLGNTATQGLNIASGFVQPSVEAVGNIAGTIIDSILSKALKKDRTRTVYGMNPVEFLGDYLKNYKIGAKYHWHGLQPGGLNSADEIKGLALTGKLAKVTGLSTAEKALKATAGGADYAVYKTVYDSEIRKQGYLDAKRKGVKGSKDIKQHISDFVKNPSPDAIEIADRQGKRTTFQSDKSLGGRAAKLVNSASPGLKFGAKAVVPFIRTPANIASTAVSLTPAGFIKGAIRLIKAKTPSDRSDAIRDIGLGITGGAGLTSLGYALSELGIITDENESGNSNLDKLREQAGGGVFRFNQSGLARALSALYNGEGWEGMKKAAKYQEDDSTFDYNKLQPIAFPVAAGASYQKAREEGGTVGQSAAKSAQSAGGSLMSMSALKSIQDITNTGFNKTPSEEATGVIQRIAESYLKSFSPSLFAQEARREDTTQRQPPTQKGFSGILPNVGKYYQSRTPDILGKLGVPTSSQLPARLTTLGQEKKNPEGVVGTYLNPYKSQQPVFNKAAQRVAELIERTKDESLAPSAPDKKISGKMKSTRQKETVELTPQQYEQYQKEIGQEITDKINALPNTLTDAQLTKRISSIYDSVKEKYKNRMRKKLGMYMS